MNINWGGLGLVSFVSFGAAVGVVVLVAFALIGLSARATGAAADDVGTADRAVGGLSAAAGTVVAGVCLLATAAIVGYALWIIVS